MLTVAVLCLLSLTSLAAEHNCKLNIENKGSTFDLNPLNTIGGFYVSDGQGNNFTYVFNLCGAVTSVPYECDAKIAPGSEPEAFQLTDSGECFVLSGGTSSPVLDLLDLKNPSRGMMITHSDGEPCGDKGTNRKFTVFLECADVNGFSISGQRVVEEQGSCQYSITIPSRYACPLECPVSRSAGLCSGKGLCAFDRDSNKSQCFCDTGYEGADCAKVIVPYVKPGLSAGQVTLIICIVILGVLLIAGLGLLCYLGKLRPSKESVPFADVAGGGVSAPTATITLDQEAETVFSVE